MSAILAEALDEGDDPVLAQTAESVRPPIGFPRQPGPFDVAFGGPEGGRPLVVFALEWGLRSESQEDSLVLGLFKLAAFTRDNFISRAYLVVAAPTVVLERPSSGAGRELGEGTSRLLELFEGERAIGADELERITPGWWYGDRDKPKVPRQIELSALDPVTLADRERGDWELRCVRVGVKREWPSFEEKHARDESLLAAIKERLPDLEALLQHFRSIEEDAVYPTTTRASRCSSSCSP